MTTRYMSENAEIIALFVAAGKQIPTEDSDTGVAIQILQRICDSQSHTVPHLEKEDEGLMAAVCYDIFEALEEIENNLASCCDFRLDFDGNEYRIIADDGIWNIYRDAIQGIVEECYSDVLDLDKVPSFIAISVDWEQTAQNAFIDGYGHTFSGHGGSEENVCDYWIFRTN